jgi:hypothetical protein
MSNEDSKPSPDYPWEQPGSPDPDEWKGYIPPPPPPAPPSPEPDIDAGYIPPPPPPIYPNSDDE